MRGTLYVLLALNLAMTSYCSSLGGLSGLRAAMNAHKVFVPERGRCNFDIGCDWQWNRTDDTFRLVKAPLPNQLAPNADADGNPQGKF